ncbi:fatty acyl-CoA reductase wat-like [Melanaphis sacchari]|uniref:Fatty acyl-CoA reductase n=1 Tax=Melanaphis sacchari TaxID=742174 RepID=A0A2H8TTR7_9HEMI|nr:fatty acyl-CoA reductase wat-like [Melanaphis sacchari]
MEGGDIFIQDFINDLQESPESQIQKCFRGTGILITGGTGFIGKVLIEKLLRSCRDLNTIYLVVRLLNGQNPNERVKEMFTSPFFDRMKRENPTYRSQVQVVRGDCFQPNIGIDEVDLSRIESKINVVIHLAAATTTIHPYCMLNMAVCINVRGTRDLIVLIKRFQNLKAFVYVSSAFTNPSILDVYEQFYNFPIPASTLIQMVETLPDYILNRVTSGLVSEWPDVLTFTKALAEQIIQSAGSDLPACIIRPGFVLGTANEPIAGWTNDLNNLTGCALGSGLGLVRVFYGPSSVNAEIVPVDMLVNLLLAACWELIGNRTDVVNEEVPKDAVNTLIYNYASSNYKPCTWNQLGEKFFKNEKNVSSSNFFWMPFYCVTNSIFIYWIMTLYLHTIPAKVVDLFIWLVGKKSRLNEFYERVHAAAKHLRSYQQMHVRYHNHNVKNLMNKLSLRDKILFDFDMSTLSWDDYFDKYLKGLRVYLMGNPLQMPGTNNNTLNRLITIHYNFIISICVVIAISTIYFYY